MRHGIGCQSLALREDALDHLDLAKRAQDGSPLDRGLARRELHRPAVGKESPIGVARGPPVTAESVVQPAEARPIPSFVGPADGGIRKGHCTLGVSGGKCQLRGACL